MATKPRKRDPQAEALTALRRRSRNERAKLEKLYTSLSAESQRGEEGRAIKQMQEQIASKERETYLGRRASKEKRLEATMAANRLQRMIGQKGKRERLDAQTRRNRITREQIRLEEEGGTSAYFGGQAGAGHYERIFYMSTQSIWAGLPNADRDEAIMKALGVSSLRDAYDLVIAQNEEAIEAMHEAFGNRATKWQRGDSDTVMNYISNMINFIDER